MNRASLGLGLLLLLPALLWAVALSTSFADVQITDVPLGKPFAVRGPEGDGLILRNEGNVPFYVRVDGIVPGADQLRGGAASIPDLLWVRITPDHFVIPAHGTYHCAVSLNVPNRKEHRRKLFQVMLWSRTAPIDGHPMEVSAGLLSRLRFKTAP
jgi:hypothetical protein